MATFNNYPSNFQSDYQNYPRGYPEARPSAPLLQQYPNPDPRLLQQPYQQPSAYRPAPPVNLKLEKTKSRLFKISRIIRILFIIAGVIAFISMLYCVNFLTSEQYDSNNPYRSLVTLIAVADFGILIIAAIGIRAAHLKTTKAIKNYLRALIILAIGIAVASFFVCSADFQPSSNPVVENVTNAPDFTKYDIELGNFQSSILYRGHSLPRVKPNLEEWKVVKDRKWNKTIKVKADLLQAGETSDGEYKNINVSYDSKEDLSYVWTNAIINMISFFLFAILGKKFLKAAKKYESLCSQNHFNFQQSIQPIPGYVFAQQPHMAVAGSRVH